MIREICIAPDPILKKKSSNVEVFDNELKELVNDMFQTVRYTNAIGLSAVQIGILKKIITIEIDNKKLTLINAEVINHSEDTRNYQEGCLSFPNIGIDIVRPKEITVRYKTLDGIDVEESFGGLVATCIQHEIDHTNGIVFTDYVSRLKRDIIMRKLHKFNK